jgi:hypothetical protein
MDDNELLEMLEFYASRMDYYNEEEKNKKQYMMLKNNLKEVGIKLKDYNNEILNTMLHFTKKSLLNRMRNLINNIIEPIELKNNLYNKLTELIHEKNIERNELLEESAINNVDYVREDY